MKQHKHYLLHIITLMVMSVSFDLSASTLIDNSTKTEIEVCTEEESTKLTLDKEWLVNIWLLMGCSTLLTLPPKTSKALFQQHALSGIFKPPQSLYPTTNRQ